MNCSGGSTAGGSDRRSGAVGAVRDPDHRHPKRLTVAASYGSHVALLTALQIRLLDRFWRRYGELLLGLAEFVAVYALGRCVVVPAVGGGTAAVSAQPLSPVALRQITSTFSAAMLTTVGTYVIGFQHPPAYAATLIVSRGILTSLAGVGFFLVALLVMVGLHETVGKRFPIWNLSYERD